jgi:hypothetical protein
LNLRNKAENSKSTNTCTSQKPILAFFLHCRIWNTRLPVFFPCLLRSIKAHERQTPRLWRRNSALNVLVNCEFEMRLKFRFEFEIQRPLREECPDQSSLSKVSTPREEGSAGLRRGRGERESMLPPGRAEAW